jgi:acyl-CoA thioesterase
MSSADAAESGFEFLRRLAATSSGVGDATFGQLLGMRLVTVELGRVEFRLATRPEFANPLGTMHGGVVASMLDSALGCAVHSTLDAGDWYTTLELKVNFTRPPDLQGHVLRASGEVVHVGRTSATAEGRVHDEHDKLVAHGTTTCLVRRA